MTATLQALLVAAIVVIATAYSVQKLMPAAWRRSLALHAGAWATRAGLSQAHVRRVEAKLASGGACGSCDSCKACASTREDGSALATPPPGYRSIPIRHVSS